VSGFASLWMGEHLGMLVGNLLLGGTIFLIIGVGWLVLFSQAERIRVRSFLVKKL